MSTVYANMFRYKGDIHQVRLIFLDQRTDYDSVMGHEMGMRTDVVSEVAMTRQSFSAFMDFMRELENALPPIGIPGQPYPPVFAQGEERSE
jgi:hypothetical protein